MSTTLRLPGSGGVHLAADVWGDAGAPPLVLLHGGGQTRGAWGAAGQQLAALGWRALAVDLRGHGDSDWSPDGGYELDRFAGDIAAIAAALERPPVIVGASLGGLSSLLAVGELGAPARALVLVDVAHRPHPAGARRVVEFMSGAPEGFGTIAEAAAAVAAYLPQRRRPETDDGLRRNLRRNGNRWVWHWDPRLLEGFSGSADAFSAADRHLAAARAAEVPILLVRGAISDVIDEDIAHEFVQHVPSAELVQVDGAGHMVAGDRNEFFIDAVLPFLEAL